MVEWLEEEAQESSDEDSTWGCWMGVVAKNTPEEEEEWPEVDSSDEDSTWGRWIGFEAKPKHEQGNAQPKDPPCDY